MYFIHFMNSWTPRFLAFHDIREKRSKARGYMVSTKYLEHILNSKGSERNCQYFPKGLKNISNLVTNSALWIFIVPKICPNHQITVSSPLGAICNSLLIYLISTSKELHKASNYLILNLALGDLLTAIGNLPFDSDFLLHQVNLLLW